MNFRIRLAFVELWLKADWLCYRRRKASNQFFHFFPFNRVLCVVFFFLLARLTFMFARPFSLFAIIFVFPAHLCVYCMFAPLGHLIDILYFQIIGHTLKYQ